MLASIFPFFLRIYTILQPALFFFTLTWSHEHWFISLNMYGRHHSKLFSSPLTGRHILPAVPGRWVRRRWEPVAWSLGAPLPWRRVPKPPLWLLAAFRQPLATRGPPASPPHVLSLSLSLFLAVAAAAPLPLCTRLAGEASSTSFWHQLLLLPGTLLILLPIILFKWDCPPLPSES